MVALVHAPEGFEAKLAPLPEGARVERRMGDADVILAFVKSAAALGRELPALAREMQAGRTLWLIWPKKTSPLAGDLGQPKVREMGLAIGLVDYKVCAVDETWSGLAFAVRAAKGGARGNKPLTSLSVPRFRDRPPGRRNPCPAACCRTGTARR